MNNAIIPLATIAASLAFAAHGAEIQRAPAAAVSRAASAVIILAQAQPEQKPAAQRKQEAAGQATPPAGKSEAAAGGAQSATGAAASPTPPPLDPQALQQMAGTEAVTIDGKKVGELAKVVQKPGGVYGAVIETGGFLGIGETRHVVPLDRIRVQNAQIVVDMSSAELDKVPILETDRWENLKK